MAQDPATLPQLPPDPTGLSADPQTAGDPLGMLEDLLKQAQSQGGGPGAPPPTPENADGTPTAKTPDQKAAEQAQLEQMRAEQKVIDDQLIAQQQIKMQQIKQSPEYQARVSQDSAADDSDEAEKQAGEGYEIVQLDHTKI